MMVGKKTVLWDSDSDGESSAKVKSTSKSKNASEVGNRKSKTTKDTKNSRYEDSNVFGGDNKFQINEQFAKKYEERKRNEELSALREKYGDEYVDRKLQNGGDISGDDDDDTSSEIEDEDAALITPQVEQRILKTISLIKARDPAIYDANHKFFTEEEFDKARSDWETKERLRQQKKHSSMTLGQYEHQINVQHGGVIEDEDTANQPESHPSATFEDEQVSLKKAFLQSVDELEKEEFTQKDPHQDHPSFGGLLLKRDKTREQQKEEDAAFRAFLLAEDDKARDEERRALATLRRYWTDPNLDEKEKFLRDYLLHQGWMDRDETAAENENDNAERKYLSSEDEIEREEEFERAYNFRFEEPDSNIVLGHARQQPDSMRRKDEKRRDERLEKESRKNLEKQKKQEELNRLQKLKKQEISHKIDEIQDSSHLPRHVLEKELFALLQDDLSLEEYDRKMKKLFDDQYYDAEEDDQQFKKDVKKKLYEDLPQEEQESDKHIVEEKVEKVEKPQKATKKTSSEKLEKLSVALKTDMEDLNRLGYEGFIKVDEETLLPTKFKYARVESRNYGLEPWEILLAEDDDLNSFMGLKKYAAYRPSEVELRDERKRKRQLTTLREKLAFKIKRIPEEEESVVNNDHDGDDVQAHKDTETKKRKRSESHSAKEDEEDRIEQEDALDQASDEDSTMMRSKRRMRKREKRMLDHKQKGDSKKEDVKHPVSSSKKETVNGASTVPKKEQRKGKEKPIELEDKTVGISKNRLKSYTFAIRKKH